MSDEISAPAAGIDFSSLPTVEQVDPAAGERRVPRFDGDMSELPDRACWALQHLLTRRYISKERDPDVWSWIMTYRRKLTVRLSELDLRLRIAEGLEVGFVEQVDYEPSRGRKVMRRETLGTYDSILALHLAKMMRASTDEHVLISREDVHALFTGVVHDVDRNEVALLDRVNGAITRLDGVGILQQTSDDDDTFIVSPVITAVMTALMITELEHQFEQLAGAQDSVADGEAIDIEVDVDHE